MKDKHQGGFGLIEVMVTVAIIGILLAIAYPSYQSHIINSHRAEVESTLEAMATAMERYRGENSTYAGARGAGNIPNSNVFPSQAPIDSSDKVYNLTIPAEAERSYTLRATPIAGTVQDGNGYLELTSTGIKRWDKDNSGSTSASENTWQD